MKRQSLAMATLALTASVACATETWVDPVVGMAFVSIPKGCFEMGRREPLPAPLSDAWTHLGYRGDLAADERPQHKVCLDAFQIGQFELRADEWQRVMGMPPPNGAGNRPASGMTWDQAQAFVERLNSLAGSGREYRLPTEAEWEYACRAGSRRDQQPELYGGDRIAEIAWYNDPPRVGERLYEAKPVGQRRPNAWAIHDMLGNVWEWTDDGYRPDGYRSHGLYNPRVKPVPSGQRVIRGGSYRSEFPHMRCGNRSRYAADGAMAQIGVRLVRQSSSRENSK